MSKKVEREIRQKQLRKLHDEDFPEEDTPFRLKSNLLRAWFGKNDLQFEKKQRRRHERSYE